MGILNLPRSGCHSPSIIHPTTDRRGRDDHNALSRGTRRVSCPLHPKLDLSVSLKLNLCTRLLTSCRASRTRNAIMLIKLSSVPRYATEPIGFDPISFLAGVVQTALYVDFFYIYLTRYVPSSFLFLWSYGLRTKMSSATLRVLQGEKFELPA